MATRKELLKNLKNYSPEEIAEAVREGVVSLYELSKETEGAFTPLLKKKVKKRLLRCGRSLLFQEEIINILILNGIGRILME